MITSLPQLQHNVNAEGGMNSTDPAKGNLRCGNRQNMRSKEEKKGKEDISAFTYGPRKWWPHCHLCRHN